MRTLLLTFVICYSISLDAQPVYNYLDNSSEWRYFSSDISTATYSWTTEYFDGDTIINGITYYKKYIIRKDSSLQTGDVTISQPIARPFIRENAELQFISTWGDGTEWVSEDFSLTIGDFFPWISCPIFSIDTVYLGTTALKRYAPETPPIQDVDAYVEGIGNTGPFCTTGIDGFSHHVCYSKANDTISFNPNIYNFPIPCNSFVNPLRTDIPTSLDQSLGQTSFKIYPNPARNNIIIQHRLKSPVEIRIYDISGTLRQQHHNVVSGKGLSIEGLAKGFYILGYYSDNSLIESAKLIKE